MLPSMNDDILGHLLGRGVSTVSALLDFSREELHRLLQPFSASELYQVLLFSLKFGRSNYFLNHLDIN